MSGNVLIWDFTGAVQKLLLQEEQDDWEEWEDEWLDEEDWEDYEEDDEEWEEEWIVEDYDEDEEWEN
ncbi:MAG: hypothetical protein GXO39_09115 [Thermotogae bacterium]|nr:hypothetical protein [Thermotogota bacterium]